jgi:hypothetical protein
LNIYSFILKNFVPYCALWYNGKEFSPTVHEIYKMGKMVGGRQRKRENWKRVSLYNNAAYNSDLWAGLLTP